MGFVVGDLVRITGNQSKLNPDLSTIDKTYHNKVFRIFKVEIFANKDIEKYYLDMPESNFYVVEDEIESAKREELLGE